MDTPGLSQFTLKGIFSMNRLSAITLALSASLFAALPAAAVEVGAPAPEFTLSGSRGAVNLAALKGKVVYLDFWASWCGPCRQSFPWMNEMQAKYGAKGLQVVGVNLDAKRADADKFLAEVPANFMMAFDEKGDTPRRYAIKGMPTSLLIGPDGKVIRVHAGFREEERKQLEEAISAALK
jgi:cytochrome c biogenesis protein CcmG/thiol:disulfide interchange protein DsbE